MFKRFIFGSGITIDEEFTFSNTISIRPIVFPRDHCELADYASSQICYGFLCALAETLTFEIELSENTDKEAAISEWNNQWLLILLSVIVRSPVHFPFRSSQSSSELKAGCCDVKAAIISPAHYNHKRPCTVSELEKAKALYKGFFGLLEDRAFSHAASVAALNYNETKSDIRMAAIWSAIEALIGVEHELSYRIPLLCSIILELEKDNRLTLFNKVQKLYQARSRCVHGAGMKPEPLKEALDNSQELLCRLIEWTCEKGEVLSPQKAKMLPLIT